MAKLKHDSGSSLENTRIIRARLPGARNMVIVAQPRRARGTTQGQRDHATSLDSLSEDETLCSHSLASKLKSRKIESTYHVDKHTKVEKEIRAREISFKVTFHSRERSYMYIFKDSLTCLNLNRRE